MMVFKFYISCERKHNLIRNHPRSIDAYYKLVTYISLINLLWIQMAEIEMIYPNPYSYKILYPRGRAKFTL